MIEDIKSRAGGKSDIRRIKALLKKADLPYEDIDIDRQHFIVALHGANTIGIVGLEPHGKCGLLRSLAVEEAYRGQGLGRALVSEMIGHAKDMGIKQLFLLTLTADRFFDKEGFERISRESMPEAIQNSTEFKSICPVSSICMKKEI
jgi:amino-acid N-acetyltransferase